MSLAIRLATLDEAPLVHALMRAAFAEYAGLLQPPTGALRETAGDVRAHMERGGAILAFLDGQPVASARFEPRAEGYMYVGRVSVVPAQRGRGIGRAVMAWLEAHALALGLPEARLGVRAALPQNRRFYEGLGYAVYHELRRDHSDVVLWLRKRLGAAANGPGP